MSLSYEGNQPNVEIIELNEMSDGDLVRYIQDQLHHDIRWKELHTDFERAIELYEQFSGATESEDGVPNENKIRKAVDERLSLYLENFSEAKLQAVRNVEHSDNPIEVDVKTKAYDLAEETFNDMVVTILQESKYDQMKIDLLKDAITCGSGFLLVEINTKADLRFDLELRELLRAKESWTEKDAIRFTQLLNKVRVRYLDPRDVYLQHSMRKYDESVTRFSVVKRYTLNSLRSKWINNPYNDVSQMKEGKHPYFIEDLDQESRRWRFGSRSEENISAEITTYVIEPYIRKESYEYVDEDGMKVSVDLPELLAYRTHRIVIAGGVLVEKEQYDFDEGSGLLPLIPLYVDEAKDHAYGYSLPLSLEFSQRFSNLMKAILYESARNTVSNNAVAVLTENLGLGDEEEIDHVLEHGGVAKLSGNNLQGPTDVRNMVMPLNYTVSQLQPAILQALQLEEAAFGSQSASVDMSSVGRARGAAGKRQQVAIQDRPKAIGIELISNMVESLYNVVYEFIRINYPGESQVVVRRLDGTRETVSINKEETFEFPVLSFTGEPMPDPNNPEQPHMKEMTITANDTKITMIAEADGRGPEPINQMQKAQYYALLGQMGLEAEYILERVLTREQFVRNSEYKKTREQQEQQQMQMMQMMQQQQQQQQPMAGQIPGVPSGNVPVDGMANIAPNDATVQ